MLINKNQGFVTQIFFFPHFAKAQHHPPPIMDFRDRVKNTTCMIIDIDKKSL